MSDDDVQATPTTIPNGINVFLFQPSMTIINAVKMRPALYDTRLPANDRTKTKRKKLWNEIGEMVYAPISDIRRRWRALRDRYTKYRRQYLAFLQDVHDKSDIKLPQFQYYRHLKFLEPIVEHQSLNQSKSHKVSLKKESNDEGITTEVVQSVKISNEDSPLQIALADDQTDTQSSQQSSEPREVNTLLLDNPTLIKCEVNPLTINFDDPLDVDETTTQQFIDFTSFGKMLAIRLRQLNSKRLARHCEIEIMNMMMNAELQDCGEM